MKKVILNALLTVALVVFSNQTTYAGFPIGNGRWLLVPTYTKYSADSYWNSTGEIVSFANTGRYESNYLGLYGGVGVGRDLDFVFNIPYVTQRYFENGNLIEQLSTVGDVTAGLSYFLNHYDYFKHLSITGSIIIPMYPNLQNTYLLPGFSSTGAEVKLGLAGTNTNTLKDTYYDIEAGVRTYFNSNGPTVLFGNATLGVPLNEDWKISGTVNVVSASSNSGFTTPTNPFINRDFNYVRGNLSISTRLDRNISLWASVFRDFTGRGIGQGSGYSVFALIKF